MNPPASWMKCLTPGTNKVPSPAENVAAGDVWSWVMRWESMKNGGTKKNGSKMVKNVGVAIKNRETWWNIHQKW